MNKPMLSGLLYLLMAGSAWGQAPLGWEPRYQADEWLLQQRWPQRVAHVRLVTVDGRGGEGQVLVATEDSLWWQPGYGWDELGQDAFWVKREEIELLSWQHRPKLLLPAMRTMLGTMYGLQVINGLSVSNYRSTFLSLEGFANLSALLGGTLSLGVAAFQALHLGTPRRYLRQTDGPLPSRALWALEDHSVYCKRPHRPPFWELWPPASNLQFQIETGHIVYQQHLPDVEFNLPHMLTTRFENTRLHALSLSYRLGDFNHVGVRFSPSMAAFEQQRRFIVPFVGDYGYRIHRRAQWGLWLARDLLPASERHLARAFCRVGVGAFGQKVELDQFINLDAYEPEPNNVEAWNLSQEQSSRIFLVGAEVTFQAGYRVSHRLAIIATLRRQWVERFGQSEDIFFELPPNPEASFASFRLMMLDQDQRAVVFNTGLEIRL